MKRFFDRSLVQKDGTIWTRHCHQPVYHEIDSLLFPFVRDQKIANGRVTDTDDIDKNTRDKIYYPLTNTFWFNQNLMNYIIYYFDIIRNLRKYFFITSKLVGKYS